MDNSIGYLLENTKVQFKKAGIKSCEPEAEILLCDLLGLKRIDLYLDKTAAVDKPTADRIKKGIALRRNGTPLQYLTKKAFFYGLQFEVNEDVLIPRPETEILVETVLNRLSTIDHRLLTILEIGTGSGNIAISLTKNFPYCKIIATDISKKALFVAKRNARLHNAERSIEFVCSDLFSALKLSRCNNFDFIVSNPPYIKRADLTGLSKELQFEPRLSLDGNNDGLFYYRKIAKAAVGRLKKGGFLAMELGDGQTDDVRGILLDTGAFGRIEFIEDYNKIKRVVLAKING